ncbi:MAG: DUF2179 domain-containing protein [Bacillota bacterium]|nr:DUF2179 domain-containing protein [Bacillota bacterium]MDW7676417.1 DUF2179 domain-containing protein [Bacillota bacterium]
MPAVIGYLLIFMAKVTDVSLATVRMIMVVKGKRFHAAAIGFVEVSIWILAVGTVLSRLDDPINVIMYASGFAAGNFVGIMIEEKMALGSLMVQVITYKNAMDLVDILREEGYGVTVVEGQGRSGIIHLLNVIIQRKQLGKLNQLVDELDQKAFVTIMDTRSIRGGFFSRLKRK